MLFMFQQVFLVSQAGCFSSATSSGCWCQLLKASFYCSHIKLKNKENDLNVLPNTVGSIVFISFLLCMQGHEILFEPFGKIILHILKFELLYLRDTWWNFFSFIRYLPDFKGNLIWNQVSLRPCNNLNFFHVKNIV